MLKLTVNPDKEAQSYSFQKAAVSIGDGLIPDVDISLQGENLQKVHVKLIIDAKSVYAVNVANDPFVSLNKLPFGKKTLHEGDTLQIGRTVLRIDQIEEKKETPPLPEKKQEKEPEQELYETLVPEPEAEAALEPEAAEDELEDSLLEIEKAAIPKPKKNRRLTIFIGMMVLACTLASFVGGVLYFRLSESIEEEQHFVTEAVADLAMALSYAKIHHITPQKLNWSDPDYIRNNLIHVLPPKTETWAELDFQGQLKHFPYFIRIYTELDLKQFIIIAQPIPNFTQRILPTPSLVLDSQTMEIRKIHELRDLNRLLASSSPLDETTGVEVSNLIRGGLLVPLSDIDPHSNAFLPPKTYSLIRPRAKGYVYNAPRYYPFGEALMLKAISLKENTRNNYDLDLLQYEINAYLQFPDLILYTTKGMQTALEAQKALADFAPHANFLMATLAVNSQGKFINNHLLMNEKFGEIGLLTNSPLPMRNPEAKKESTELLLKSGASPLQRQQINPNHPLQLRLSGLAAERQRVLQEITDEMVHFINKHIVGYVPDFQQQIQQILIKYEQVDQELVTKINKNLKILYQEYSTMPLSEFIAYVRVAEMDRYLEEYLQRRKKRLGNNLVLPEEIEELMHRIEISRNLSELDRHVVAAAEVLTLDHLPDIDLLIHYQNELHVKSLQKVSKLLFSPDSSLYFTPPQPANRIALTHVLKSAWVTDANEFDFFLNEYDNIFEDPADEEEEKLSPSFYT